MVAATGVGGRAYTTFRLSHLPCPGRETPSLTAGEALRKQPKDGGADPRPSQKGQRSKQREVTPAEARDPRADNFHHPTAPSHGGLTVSLMAKEAVLGTEAL